MDGFLLVDKPFGWTSFDVVAKLKSVLRHQYWGIKVGHTGTLDPAATGLLIIVIGSYTKQADQFRLLPKTYQAEVRLGAISSTGDSEGQIRAVDCLPPTKQVVEHARKTLTGQISQVPPIYSAIKIKGKRAYQLARSGERVEMKPRRVTIHQIKHLRYIYPKLSFICEVSSGTYIRSLAVDFGTELKTGGYLANLRRLKIGSWSVDRALPVADLTPTTINKSLLTIDPPG